jgi:hypothetical protein
MKKYVKSITFSIATRDSNSLILSENHSLLDNCNLPHDIGEFTIDTILYGIEVCVTIITRID